MSGFMVLSKLGIHFTADSVAEVRYYVELAKKANEYLYLSAAVDAKGTVHLAFACDYSLVREGTPDNLKGVDFNWFSTPKFLDIVRKGYCVDAKYGRETLAIPLARPSDK